jgi:hypothetical protein
MSCELLKGCLFFNTLHQHAVDELKKVYCENNPSICARRQVAMAVGREQVPLNLAPNHNHLVQPIISDALSRR